MDIFVFIFQVTVKFVYVVRKTCHFNTAIVKWFILCTCIRDVYTFVQWVKSGFCLCDDRWKMRFSSTNLCTTSNTFWSCSSVNHQSSEELSLLPNSEQHYRLRLYSHWTTSTRLAKWQTHLLKMTCILFCSSFSSFCLRSIPISFCWHCDCNYVARFPLFLCGLTWYFVSVTCEVANLQENRLFYVLHLWQAFGLVSTPCFHGSLATYVCCILST